MADLLYLKAMNTMVVICPRFIESFLVTFYFESQRQSGVIKGW